MNPSIHTHITHIYMFFPAVRLHAATRRRLKKGLQENGTEKSRETFKYFSSVLLYICAAHVQ